jgi:hypothetical protein
MRFLVSLSTTAAVNRIRSAADVTGVSDAGLLVTGAMV